MYIEHLLCAGSDPGLGVTRGKKAPTSMTLLAPNSLGLCTQGQSLGQFRHQPEPVKKCRVCTLPRTCQLSICIQHRRSPHTGKCEEPSSGEGGRGSGRILHCDNQRAKAGPPGFHTRKGYMVRKTAGDLIRFQGAGGVGADGSRQNSLH